VVGSVDVGSGAGCAAVPAGGGLVPETTGTGSLTAALVLLADPLSFARIATAAPSAAMTSAASTGQIQSPGYQGTRRRQAFSSTGTSPSAPGRRRPHSRQYSWTAA